MLVAATCCHRPGRRPIRSSRLCAASACGLARGRQEAWAPRQLVPPRRADCAFAVICWRTPSARSFISRRWYLASSGLVGRAWASTPFDATPRCSVDGAPRSWSVGELALDDDTLPPCVGLDLRCRGLRSAKDATAGPSNGFGVHPDALRTEVRQSRPPGRRKGRAHRVPVLPTSGPAADHGVRLAEPCGTVGWRDGESAPCRPPRREPRLRPSGSGTQRRPRDACSSTIEDDPPILWRWEATSWGGRASSSTC
jgi:hypothetical protein